MDLVKQICTQFCAMQSLQDLHALLNFVCSKEATLKQGFPSKIAFSKLNYCLFTKDVKYKTYLIPKKGQNKPPREIHAPKDTLKQIQSILNFCLQAVFEPKKAAHGFVKQRSIVSNACAHVGRPLVYNIDLENFFPSIHFGRIRGVFSKAPFNFNPDLARMLANLCCHEGKLPQGAPTSPVLSNLVCRSLDFKLVGLANHYKIRYTRYADDITFSANKNVFENEAFQQELQGLIIGEGFLINQEKVRLQSNKERQMVTGLVVNKKVNITSKFKRELRWMIHLWEKHGQEAAQKWLDDNYQLRHRYNGKVPKIEQVIDGHLNFMKMVVGEKNEVFKKISHKLNECRIDFQLKHESDRISIYGKKEVPSVNSPLAFTRVISNLKNFIDKDILDVMWTKGLNPYSSDHLKITEHNPLFLTALLHKLFSTNDSFRSLTHGTAIYYPDIVEKGKIAWTELEQKLESNPREEKIRREVFNALKTFVKKLNADNRKEKYQKTEYGDFLIQNESEIIFPFSRLIRIGDLHKYWPLEDMFNRIFKIINANNVNEGKKYVLEGVNNLEKINTYTSVFNIYLAVYNIVTEQIQKNTVRFSITRRGNKSILSIIDVDSVSDNDSIKIRGGMRQLISILWGVCDLNCVWANSNNSIIRQKILPIPSEDDKISIIGNAGKGFTFELIFHDFPRQILLVDDDDKRRESYEGNFKKFSFLTTKRRLPDNWERAYNWLFIHQTYESDNLSEIENTAKINEIELWKFTGGQSTVAFEGKTIGQDFFYEELLPEFCKELSQEQEPSITPLNLSIESIIRSIQGENRIELKRKILERIDKNGLVFPELDQETYKMIGKFRSPQDDESKQFKNMDSLEHFLDLRLKSKLNNEKTIS